MADTEGATITMTVNMAIKLVASAVGFSAVTVVGALWLLWTFTMGSVQSDVSDIRNALTTTQDRNLATSELAHTTDSELAKLTAELKITNASLANLRASVDGLGERITTVDATLNESVKRQENFERWVAIRLGPIRADASPIKFPAEWQPMQDDLFGKLATGSDPFIGWYEAVNK